MALEKADLKLITIIRKKYQAGKNLCIIGDCQFHFTAKTLFEITGFTSPRRLTTVTHHVFAESLGFKKSSTLDISGSPTHKLDLGEPLPKHLINKFDWVIDAGTLYWCFDIPRVLRNLTLLLKKDGIILHISSLCGYLGRGYYSLQPRLFTDFYNNNGFKVLSLGVRARPPAIYQARPWSLLSVIKLANSALRYRSVLDWRLFPPGKNFLDQSSPLQLSAKQILPEPNTLPNNSLLMCLAQKSKSIKFTHPILIKP